ncbi:MAG: glycerophosphodiester phosphodiesterase family protein [Corynebacterium sp.]|nr:glycerophosphodiester phosphodiesterase family protein [Corynebacterium sp.]
MKIIAHRGYSGKYPELSPIAFEQAFAQPIFGVECDIRLSKDGVIVVHHDATLNRTSDRCGKVSSLLWKEIACADIGGEDYPGQHPLQLSELLEMHKGTGKHLFIETKHPSIAGPALEKALVAELRRHNLLESEEIHAISFSHSAIRRMKQLAPRIDRIYLRREWERTLNPNDILFSDPTGLGLSVLRARLRPASIGAHGLPTYMWTVNRPEDMRWAWANGVDMIATDEVTTALQTLKY